ncbi:MAG: Rne/Rng family ribonuclease [Desulfovibrio sp.]|nr:Rne/Rng family ribonuclease [Desulfovibrio sp.]
MNPDGAVLRNGETGGAPDHAPSVPAGRDAWQVDGLDDLGVARTHDVSSGIAENGILQQGERSTTRTVPRSAENERREKRGGSFPGESSRKLPGVSSSFSETTADADRDAGPFVFTDSDVTESDVTETAPQRPVRTVGRDGQHAGQKEKGRPAGNRDGVREHSPVKDTSGEAGSGDAEGAQPGAEDRVATDRGGEKLAEKRQRARKPRALRGRQKQEQAGTGSDGVPEIREKASGRDADDMTAGDVTDEGFGKRVPSAAKGQTVHESDDAQSEDVQAGSSPSHDQHQRKGNRKMFFSVLAGERIEVALTADGKLSEYYLDMLHQKKLKGNIYKGTIQNIDTNLQAAFVDYGTMKNGFLQIDEIHKEYWLAHHEPSKGNKFPPIQKVIKPGQEVLVQVVKEPTGNKGAFLTTWLSLAGRFLVLTPGQDQIGVSRKVVDESERARLKELINGIDSGEEMGVIVRTVSAGTTKTTLKNDLQYLKRIWKDIRKKAVEVSAPSLIYSEPSLVERAVRDYLTEDVCEIWVDDENVAETVRNMVNLLFPRKRDLVRLYVDKKLSLWDRFNLRRQIEQVYSREVFLPSGGRLVFDQTEALMAVDVNSGKISCKGNFEAMAYKTNMEAAESIAKQLRLRDVGGQVVIDFIEMRERKHVEDVERNLRMAMRNDRARHDIEHMSSFGLLELVRQRTGFSALSITQEPCPYCAGTGQRRNLEWQSLQAASDIQRQMRTSKAPVYTYEATPELGMYLLNHKREMLQELEEMYGKRLEITIRRTF